VIWQNGSWTAKVTAQYKISWKGLVVTATAASLDADADNDDTCSPSNCIASDDLG